MSMVSIQEGQTMRRTVEWIATAVNGRLIGSANDEVTAVVTDSREASPGALYVARRGETSDGHDYIDAAIANGALAVVVETPREECAAAQIVVEESTIALGRLAHAHLEDLRANGDIKVVAVTGSAGKTTTKDLLAQILGATAPTVAPKLSFNNEVGLPLTVLTAQETTRYLVLEMGASGPGHLRYLTDIAAPDIAIELMVGHAHLGGFGSVEGIAEAKAELIDGLRPEGTAILNADDAYVRAMADRAPAAVRYFSTQGAAGVDYRAENIVVDEHDRASFTFCAGDETAEVSLKLVGPHHVHNALAAASACCELGVSVAEVARVLSQARPLSPHRMDVREMILAGHEVVLIDDSYNANVDSMRAALSSLGRLGSDRLKIAVLGEMLELGEASEATHREVAQMAREAGVSVLIALGEEARPYCEGQDPDTKTIHVMSCEEACDAVVSEISCQAVIVVKGSYGSGAWRVADALKERGVAQ